jgi:hypothetical protein
MMTADDQRHTLREAADLTGKSVATLRRRIKDGRLPGAPQDPTDPTCIWYVPETALLAAGLLTAEQLAAGESEAVLARRRAEGERAADHDELVTLRAEKAMLHRENQLLRDQLVHAQKLASTIVASFGKGRAA